MNHPLSRPYILKHQVLLSLKSKRINFKMSSATNLLSTLRVDYNGTLILFFTTVRAKPADDRLLIYFLFFTKKQHLTFRANCHLRRHFARNVRCYFLGKSISKLIADMFLIFKKKKHCYMYFMQIVSQGDNLHEMSNAIFWGKIFQN